MKSLKKLAAEKVEWLRLENATGVDTGPLTEGACCRDPGSIREAIEKGHAACLAASETTSIDDVVLAARAGRLDVARLVWQKCRGDERHHSALVRTAASAQKSAILNWALRVRSPHQHAINDAASLAALRGNVACFEQCLDFRPALSVASAIKGGDGDILDMTLERVTGADARDFALAAKLGSVRALETLLRYGDAWDDSTPRAASVHGHVACLRFAHENGCRWSTSVLYTKYRDCLDYALKHGCGASCTVCPDRKRETRFKIGGSFFKNHSPAAQDSAHGRKETRVKMTGLECQRAALFHMLHDDTLPASVAEAVRNVAPERSLKRLLAFKLGTVEKCVKPRDFKIFRFPTDKNVDDAMRLEALAFRYETGSKMLKIVFSELSLFYSEKALSIRYLFHTFHWSPEEDVVRATHGARRASIDRSDFIVGDRACHPIFGVASFLFRRPLADALSIFVEGTYGDAAAGLNFFGKSRVQHFDSMDRLLNHFSQQDDDVVVDDDEPLPSEPDLETKFVMFLREHGVAVRDELTRDGVPGRRSLRRNGGAFAVDHYVLEGRTMNDERSRMSVDVDELIGEATRLPHDNLLAVVFLFSLPIVELEKIFADKPRESEPGREYVRVSARDYCRLAVV